jgi:hypothetical protein
MSRFSPEEYKPEGGFSLVGLPFLLALLCAGAVGLGWLASFIGQWFYLILLFPLGIGLGLIAVGVFAGHLTKMRSTFLACVLGLVSAAVAMLAMHYFDYQRFVKEFQEGEQGPRLVEGKVMIPDPKAQTVHGLFSFLDFEAQHGVEISGRGGRGFNIGYTGTWIYWSLELLAVAVMSTLGLIAGGAAPFCSTCNQWKEDHKLGTLRMRGVDVANVVRSGDIDRLKDHDPAPSGGDVVVTVAVCPNCKSDSTIAVKLESVTKNAKGEQETNQLVHMTYPGAALPEFDALFGPEPPA